MSRNFVACLAAAAALAFSAAAPVEASPIPYINAPMDTPNSAVNALISNLNATTAPAQSLVACTGTTTATCQGLRVNVSVTGLTTAGAGALSAVTTVTDAAVTASSQIICEVNGYAGTGVPNTVNVIPGAGSFTFQVQNSAASAVLNATVVNACLVYN